MKKILIILAGLIGSVAYGQLNGGFVQTGGAGVTKGNLSTEGQSSINFNNVFGFPDSLQIASWAHETTSRTIYVATTGNDDIGTGAVGAPYATVGKALTTINKTIDAGVTVTISIGAGTFTVSSADMATISTYNGPGTITLTGTQTLVESGFTMGAADATDILKYSVSGGNTASWTTNQWKFYFLKSGSLYYPITHNTTTTLSLVGQFTGTEIYQNQTILNITNNLQFILSINLNFQKISLNCNTTSIITISDGAIGFTECYIYSTTSGALTFFDYVTSNKLAKIRCSFSNIKINTGNIGNYVYYYNTSSTVSSISLNGDHTIAQNLVIENTGTGTAASAIYSNQISRLSVANILKFVNCNVCLMSEGIKTGYNIRADKLVMVNSNYLCRKSASEGDYEDIKIKVNSVYGTPNTRWFYDNIYEFVNLSSGRNIKIPGIIYPEFEQNLSSSLTDNSTTNVIIGNKLQNRSIILDYTIKRGTTYEVGRIKVLNDGTNLTIQEDTPLGDVGVTFAVDYNTNEIRLNCTLTSTGTGATIYYNAQRVMITPLTL